MTHRRSQRPSRTIIDHYCTKKETIMKTFITAKELGQKLHYTPRHINEYLKDRIFFEGSHYIRLPGSRKILYIWENIMSDLTSVENDGSIPMANGGVCHG
jgi:hypothetical protein